MPKMLMILILMMVPRMKLTMLILLNNETLQPEHLQQAAPSDTAFPLLYCFKQVSKKP